MSKPSDKSRLSDLPIPARIALTLFAALIVSGMAVSGILVNLSLREDWVVTVPRIERIQAKYAWSPIKGAALTSMREYLVDQEEVDAITKWCDQGGQRTGFYENVYPVLERRCLRCHGGETVMGNVSMTTWGDVANLSTIRGMPARKLALQTHNHVLGIGLLALMAGIMISFTGYSTGTRVILVAIPFLAMAADIGSWWLCRMNPDFSWVIWIAGFAMVASLSALPLLAVWDMWRPRPSKSME
ncbi:MAG: hypothetical protein CVV64_14360 [Candidatus Wallbacteria bacterium HGW-Wallbacteria-1]|jgi:hypothetical protein|uniref:Elongation factor-1 alpha n=1 Tax=Candidatus Wallbacteria bacterium HGW-Wallbacteria-1 TaxID=2013854 RepID=A0A2N1PM97_9BACT|nr:MAG: hypothetical protein CVV64_14360 [Candidatus Wallbacteria bacterium HGW-Wallbacteria-1]